MTNIPKLSCWSQGLPFSDINDIKTALQNPGLLERVTDLTNAYYPSNIAETMHDLATVVSLLQSAYTSSLGNKVNPSTELILGNFQEYIKESKVICNDLEMLSLEAIRGHVFTQELLNQEIEPEKFTSIVKKIEQYQADAKVISGQIKKSKELVELAQSAFEAAVIENTEYSCQQRALVDPKNKSDAEIHKRESTVTNLAKVKVVFENTKLFWVGVKSNCERFSSIENDLEYALVLEDISELNHVVEHSAELWLTIGKTVSNLLESINELDKKMNNLPGYPEKTT